jgi:predicted DsbA family dithiol-disulfide isomerase
MELEIWSDIACPWCYIGKRRIERALSEFEHADAVELRWRSFELDPTAPAELPGHATERLAAKYGVGIERAQQMNRNMTEVAAGEGLDYHLGDQRLGSTFNAHRLVHLAAGHGLEDAMQERLMRARLIEGRLVSDPAVLTELGSEVGLDADEVRAALAADSFADDVRRDEAAAHELGITGVPMFVVDRALGASGAQPPELLLSLLRQGWERAAGADGAAEHTANADGPAASDAGACDSGTCDVGFGDGAA